MRKRRFQSEDWLYLGLSELSEHGTDAVKLEAICKSAGLTRGSFYHHFPDHTAFLVAMAERWLTLQTETIIDAFDTEDISQTSLKSLNNAVLDIDYRLELGMREIARRLPAVAEIVQQADQKRLDLMKMIYQRRFNADEAQATRLAFLEYAALNGITLIDPDMAPDDQRRLVAQFQELVQNLLSAGSEK